MHVCVCGVVVCCWCMWCGWLWCVCVMVCWLWLVVVLCVMYVVYDGVVVVVA